MCTAGGTDTGMSWASMAMAPRGNCAARQSETLCVASLDLISTDRGSDRLPPFSSRADGP